MRNVFPGILILLLALGFTVNDAAARGFGGSRGFGMARSKSMFSGFSRAKQAPRAAAAKRVGAGKWRGAFTGFLLGGLLASLFMGNGLGSALLSWLALGFILVLIVNFVRRRQAANYTSRQ